MKKHHLRGKSGGCLSDRKKEEGRSAMIERKCSELPDAGKKEREGILRGVRSRGM